MSLNKTMHINQQEYVSLNYCGWREGQRVLWQHPAQLGYAAVSLCNDLFPGAKVIWTALQMLPPYVRAILGRGKFTWGDCFPFRR